MTLIKEQIEPAVEQTATEIYYPTVAELIPAHWQAETVVANGIRQYYYRTGGNKPPLVLLHGFTASNLHWVRTAKVLEEAYDVLMPDARSHGHSAAANGHFSPTVLAQDLIGLLQMLDITQPVLLGHSMGAGTAACTAAMNPALVQAIILADPAMRPMPNLAELNPDWYAMWRSQLAALKTQSHGARIESVRNFMPPGVTTLHVDDIVALAYGQAQFDLDLLELGATLHELPPWTDILGRVACPTLLLTADPARGGTTTPEAIADFMRVCRGGQHRAVAEAGHFLNYDQFEAFIEMVQQFLDAR